MVEKLESKIQVRWNDVYDRWSISIGNDYEYVEDRFRLNYEFNSPDVSKFGNMMKYLFPGFTFLNGYIKSKFSKKKLEKVSNDLGSKILDLKKEMNSIDGVNELKSKINHDIILEDLEYEIKKTVEDGILEKPFYEKLTGILEDGEKFKEVADINFKDNRNRNGGLLLSFGWFSAFGMLTYFNGFTENSIYDLDFKNDSGYQCSYIPRKEIKTINSNKMSWNVSSLSTISPILALSKIISLDEKEGINSYSVICRNSDLNSRIGFTRDLDEIFIGRHSEVDKNFHEKYKNQMKSEAKIVFQNLKK